MATPLNELAVTTARTGLTPQIWDDQFFKEYVRDNQFSRYMGTSMGSIIQLKDDLTRKAGDSVTFATTRRLSGAGVSGAATLQGSEEVLNARSLKVAVDVLRHAVAVNDWDAQKSILDLMNAGRDALMDWAMNKLRADIIAALGSITLDGDTKATLAAASDANMNSYLTNNLDRILFGALVANSVSSDWSTSMATLDGTYDLMTSATLSLAKRRAQLASPAIRPTRVNGDEAWFIVLMPSLVFRDFRKDTALQNSLLYAANRGDGNPLFTSGDLIWDGMIIREIPELPTIATGGNGHVSLITGRSYLLGAQALGIAWAQRTKSVTQNTDYGFVHGAGVQEIRGVEKLRWGTDASADKTAPANHGVFEIITTAAVDG